MSPLPPLSSDPADKPSKPSRRTHRKSRTGCGVCKQRRVKCDETKPECQQCTIFGVRCDYSSPAARPKPSQTPHGPQTLSSVENADQVDDLRLLHHFVVRKHDCTAGGLDSRDPLYDHALLLAFSHSCLMHLICEFTALKLAYEQPLRREHYRALAARHSTIGLQGATDLVRQMDRHDCHAVYTTATFACTNFFARGPQTGEYLLFSERGPSQWLPLLHGVRTIIDLVGIEKIAAGPMEQPIDPTPQATEPATVTLKCARLDWVRHFERLQAFVARSAGSHSLTDVNALSKLVLVYKATYGTGDGEFQGDANQQNIFIWPYQLGQDFMVRMQDRQPVPLIIATHFALLLQNLEFKWFMRGWSDHIISSIYRSINDEHRVWLDWPVEQAHRLQEQRKAKDLEGSSQASLYQTPSTEVGDGR
ncbi:hypothetical protein BGZ60DRAFT_367126 [Tricladium varicosporioides]|nr:hypothetical protein BGZ60DRAFT_367126 [Hymenoscyphus varicosporioides]